MPAAARACCALDAPPPFHSLQDSSRAVRWALAHVARAGDFLHLLHCVPHAGTLHGVEPGLYSPPGAEADEDGEAAAAAAMVERRFGGMLAAAGVPILKALQAAADTLSNRAMRTDALDALVLVREGAPLASALAQKKRFPGLLSMFARLGEQTGQLPLMLERAARQLSTEVQRRAMQLATLLEPLLIVVMGLVVMLIVLAVLLPIIQLNQLVR